MILNIRSYFPRLFQIFGLSGLPVHHGIAIQRPCLSSGPCRIVGVPLMSTFKMWLSGKRIIRNYMITTIIISKMMSKSGLCMTVSHIHQTFFPRCLSKKKQKFQIHHIINNDGKLPFFIWIPRFDSFYPLIITSCQGFRSYSHHL